MENDVIHIDVQKRLLSSEGTMTLDVKTDIPVKALSALFGPSGAGKTTLLRMIAGLTKPDSGIIQSGAEVWFDSKHNIHVSPQQRRIGFMFQDYALFPHMTVKQNIEFAQEKKDHTFTNRLLDVFELGEFAEKKPSNLSGGQKQRVALARALARRPKVLLLDEPLSALDAEMRIALQDEIARTQTLFEATTLMVSHDLNEVFRLAHHVICIDHGTVTAAGDPQNIFFDSSISGKFQVTGQIAAIEKQEVINIVTVITGNNAVVRVVAFDDDIQTLSAGDRVMVFSKAFNPLIKKI